MTTGSSSIGSPSTDLWVYKEWNGADSPLIPNPKRPGQMIRNRKVENPYQMTAFRRTRTMSTYDLGGGNLWTGYNMPGSGIVTVSPRPWDANDELALLQKLEEAMKGHDFQGGVFAATAPEAVRGIMGSAIALRNAWKSVHRGDIDGFFRSISRTVSGANASKRPPPNLNRKDVSSTWLALTYGWLPLVKDVYGFYEAMESAAGEDRGSTFTVTHSKKEVIPLAPFWYTANVNFRTSVRLKVRLREAMGASTYWGINNPASIAWELLPYSFVIDWFIPVGSYLSARSFIGSISASYVKSYKESYRVSDYKDNPAPYSYKLVSGATYREASTKLTRTIMSSYSVPTPDLKQIGKALSKGHLINGAALINNVISDMKSICRR